MKTITIDDFQKVELKVAEVLQAARVKKADKLLKLQLDIGRRNSSSRLRNCTTLQT